MCFSYCLLCEAFFRYYVTELNLCVIVGLAVDWITGYLYFTEKHHGVIVIYDPTYSFYKEILHIESAGPIVLDPNSR